ncbi:glycosyltransferase family 4 protein [Thalassospira sp. TSL5-1]|uniref:glycosyltransferase family 4 protein n=1 Tax=Thalassospira sp. TSL5-1 TaxID=1544451 RepID=UPI000938A716|nr:glycosyltransferase [Thalassospira sp. TSL5-1]OKH89070.1 hypothetical protein LF95_03160 [Thalassospira sp. TSL5-1]
MKIVLISNLIPPYRYNSHQILAKRVAADGGAFRIFRTHKSEPQRNWADPSGLFSQVILPGIHVPLGENRSLALNASPAPSLANFGPDIVILAGFGSAMWQAHKWCRQHDIPYIVRFDGWAGSDAVFKNPIRQKMRQDILTHAHAGMAASTQGANWFTTKGLKADQITITQIAPSFTPPTATDLPVWQHRPYDLLWCGRPTAAKGFDLFLKLAAQLAQNSTVTSIAIAGIAPKDHAAVQAKINQAEIAALTTILTAVSPGALAPIYGSAKLFVLPSYSDAYGVAVIEAIACGTLAIASDQTGCAHDVLVNGETMLPLPTSSSQLNRWIEISTHLLTNPAFRTRHLAQQQAAIANNTADTIAAQTLCICQQVLATQR